MIGIKNCINLLPFLFEKSIFVSLILTRYLNKRMLADLTIKEYLAKTAGDEAVPAGGCAAAMGAALAASLTQKIAKLIAFRMDIGAQKLQMESIADNMDALSDEFTHCIDADAKAYQELMAAHKMPSETEEEKVLRDEQIQKNTLIAAMVPFDVAEMAMRMMDYIAEVAKLADKNLLSDICTAMFFARSAALSGLQTSRTNLPSLKSKNVVVDLTIKSSEIEKQAVTKERELLDWIKSSN